ncbi:MAG: SPOR domain-containing protein [Janthinobacterium lividum]
MTLSDHLRPLLRDHDCVIIPDFGGLVAEYTSAKVQPAGRHLLSPPTRQVAFNQGLTRNDGLLVDTLRQQLGVSAAEAREHLRQAVALLHHELQAQQRTELPGIGVFRQQAGRGLQFEYTGTENLLAAAFGLPELTAQPVAVIDARLAREQQAQLVPRLRSVAKRSSRVPLRQLMRGGAIGLAAGVVAAAFYLLSLHPTVVPVAWQSYLPRWEQGARTAPTQQATLANTSLSTLSPASQPAPANTLLEELNKEVDKEAIANKELVELPTVVLKERAPTAAPKPVVAVATAPAAPVAVAPAAPKVVKPAVASKPVVSIKDSKAVALAPAAKAAVATTATAANSATTIKARTGRFYIMVAAYSSLARAEEGRRNLAHAGRPAKVILPFPGTRYYRLTAADFADRPTALAAAARLRQNPHLDKGLSVFPY